MKSPMWARLSAMGVIALLLPACGTGAGGGTLTPTVAPGIPSNVVARAGNRSATIDWSAPIVGGQYTVLRSLLPNGQFSAISVPAGFREPTTYVDTGLVNGTTYYYQVVSTNIFGASAPSPVVSVTPGFKPKAADGGGSDLVALLPDGSVWEWGEPHGGGLSDAPVQVPGLVEITAVSVNQNHNLALGSDGTVRAWGLNPSGQLGPGGAGFNLVPIPVTGITDAVAVSAGEQHSLALTPDGRVLVWGSNLQGQFGLGTTSPSQSSTPQEVPGLANIIAIEAGTYQSLALRNDGLVFSWGQNPDGQLGNPPVSAGTFPPTLISNLTGVIAISAGVLHCLALRNDGTVYAWGNNTQGQLGLGSTGAAVPTPTKTLLLTGIVDIVAGGGHSLAVRNDGKVYSWGLNTMGQLGQGTAGTPPQGTPAQVLSINNGASVAASGLNGVALESDGTVWTWGDNVKGGLGNGTGQVGQIPVELPNFTGAIDVAGGENFSLALRSNGTVWAWGDNSGGLGAGLITVAPVTTPVQTSGITTATAISAGHSHGLALLTGGTVVGWGDNQFGQVGTGTSGAGYGTPVPLPALSNITTIVCSEVHSMAIRNDGTNDRTLWTWGYNAQGQLGQGAAGGLNPTPTKISGLTGVVSVAGGDRHTIAAKFDGTVWVWGANDVGQLGQGSIGGPNVPNPTQVPGITDAVAVGAGYFHCLVVRNDGTVLAWGQNDFGQVGDGTPTNNPSPGLVPGLTNMTSVAGGNLYSLARKSDGTVWSWGHNGFGQLGNTAPVFSAVPLPVLQLSSVSTARAGTTHAVTLGSNGTIRSWGRNLFHQLGVAYVSQSGSPVVVSQ